MIAILRRKDGTEFQLDREYLGYAVMMEDEGSRSMTYYVRDEPQYEYDDRNMLIAVRYREAAHESLEDE